MCRELVSCADFKAILTPFSGVIWNRYSSFILLAIFPYNSLYTQAVAYTTYFELGEPECQLEFSRISQ